MPVPILFAMSQSNPGLSPSLLLVKWPQLYLGAAASVSFSCNDNSYHLSDLTPALEATALGVYGLAEAL